ncbi:MAG: hypothetical protein LBS42_05450 [Tannerella sp.]|jgi:hypothetical protein|nr:hypothetical protein [Tannerella sp.]
MIKSNKTECTVKILTGIFIAVVLAACSSRPRVEITHTSVETNLGKSIGRSGVYQAASISLTVYDFGKMPQVDNPKDNNQVGKWLAQYAHCYQNGKELTLTRYLASDYDFKKGKKCTLYLYYAIPDDDRFSGLRFNYEMGETTASYDGEFKNNKFKYTNGTFYLYPQAVGNGETRLYMRFHTEKQLTLRALSLISKDGKKKAVSRISPKYSNLTLANGTRVLKGSTLSLSQDIPLRDGVTLECEFDKDSTFIAQKIQFVTAEENKLFTYNLISERWEE